MRIRGHGSVSIQSNTQGGGVSGGNVESVATTMTETMCGASRAAQTQIVFNLDMLVSALIRTIYWSGFFLPNL
jgi:hypothetical protein